MNRLRDRSFAIDLETPGLRQNLLIADVSGNLELEHLDFLKFLEENAGFKPSCPSKALGAEFVHPRRICRPSPASRFKAFRYNNRKVFGESAGTKGITWRTMKE